MYSSFSSRLSRERKTWSNDSSCQTGPEIPRRLFTLRAEAPLINLRIAGRPCGQPVSSGSGVSRRYVVGHNDGGVELEASSVASQAALQYRITSLVGEWLSVVFAEGHEKPSSCFLIMRQRAAVLVHSVESDTFGVHGPCVWLGHSCRQKRRTGMSDPHGPCSAHVSAV